MARQNFKVPAATDSLHMSQPGMSQQIQSLEDELNIELFLRREKRMIERSPEGEKVFYLTQQAIRGIENIRKVGQTFRMENVEDSWSPPHCDQSVAGCPLVDEAFVHHGRSLGLGLSVIDSDAIKIYVELGLGIGIVASMAYDPMRNLNLGMVDVSYLVDPRITYPALRKETYLRQYLAAFIEMYAPHPDRASVNNALDIARVSGNISPLPTHNRSCGIAAKRSRSCR